MKIKLIPPDPSLSEYIIHFWSLKKGPENHVERLFPICESQMIFHFENPFTENPETNTYIKQPGSFVCGQLTSFKNIISNDSAELFGVTVQPYALSAILKIPACEFTDQSVSLPTLHHIYRELYEKLAAMKGDLDRKNLIEHHLKRALSGANISTLNLAADAYHQIRGAKHPLRLSALASHYQISSRQLERVFKNNIGISARKYQEISRFERSLHYLSTDLSLTAVAYKSGYFDQAHFIRSFKAFTGYAPGKYRKQQSVSE